MAKCQVTLNKNKGKSKISEVLAQKKTLSTESHDNFKVSFQYLDTSQKFGSSFKDWQRIGLLSKAMEVIKGYCKRPLTEQVDGTKFTIYGEFPSKAKTKFIKPTYIPEDAKWARIHVNGPTILVGHVVHDTFYIVFLDKTHSFFLTKKVREK